MGKSECYAALLKGNANRNIILKKYKWGEKPLERSIWVSRVAAVSRKGVSCRALTSTVGSQPSLQEGVSCGAAWPRHGRELCVLSTARLWLSTLLGSVIDLEMCCEPGGQTGALWGTCLLPVAACS